MLASDIIKEIESLYRGVTLGVAVFCIINDIPQPKCKQCNSTVTYYNKKENQFSDYCSIKCSRQSSESKQKRKLTKIEKYGEPAYNNRAKAKKTCKARYGVEYPTQSTHIKDKIKSTVRDLYVTGDLQAKRQETFLKRWGGHPQQTAEVKQKKIANTMDKYGVEHTAQLQHVIDKIQLSKEQTYQQQYQFIIEYVTSLSEPALRTDIAKHLGVSLNVVSRCIEKYKLPFKEVDIGSSVGEKELVEFLRNNGIINIVENDREILNGKEIDIYLPDYNLAIEFNGIYWHSEKYGKDMHYHFEKTKACEAKGIQLLQIWDTEWADPIKQDIWKSMILSKLGKYDLIIYARKTRVSVVSKKEAREFLNNHHLSGATAIKNAFGLYYNNELVMIATFAQSRYSKQVNTELTRLCTKRNCLVIGGASKLFSHQPHDKFVSYANARYSNGNVYKKTNMQYVSYTKPNYWYIVGSRLENRLQYQKHKLASKLDWFDSTLTEHENMHRNGYYRVWDCGNLTFIYRR